MDVLTGIGIHKARIAFHIAAVGEIENEERAGTILNAHYAVIVQGLVGAVFAFRRDGQFFHPVEKSRI
jgi:hypothetical protein